MSNEIVLKVYMHCEGCKEEVTKCLRGFDDVQEVVIDRATQKVTVRGKKLDPMRVLKKLRKKYSKNVELISPKPNSHFKELKEQANNNDNQVNLKIVVLKMNMHCVACADEINKQLQRMTGIMTVETNMEKSRVTVKGNFEAQKLVEYINKRLRKRAEILNQQTLLCDSTMRTRTEPFCLCEDNYNYNYNYNGQLFNKFQYPSLCICPDDVLSDENPLACSIL